MQRLTIDPEIAERLKELREPAIICDESGNAIGYYAPTASSPRAANESPNSTEELLRRAAEGGGRPLNEIMADLEACV